MNFSDREVEDLRLDLLLAIQIKELKDFDFLMPSLLRKFDCFRLRRDGYTLREVGAKLGIGGNRVRQNCIWMQARLARNSRRINRFARMIHFSI